MTISPDQLEWALANREKVRMDLDRADSEESLLGFIKLAWPHLEPQVPFVYGWPVEAICEHLEAVTKGQIKRLLINVPPGCMKSLTTNVFWPAWEWGPQGMSRLRYISASYEKGLATRDLVRGRDLIQSEWYHRLWPIEFKDDQNLKTYYQNSEQGWRLAASVGGALTGYRGDRINIDDPHDVKSAESEKKREESLRWFTETLPTRLNNAKESTIVVVMQRLHERDISGLILRELTDSWEKLILPMEFEQSRKCIVSVTGFEDPRKEEGQLLWPERFGRKEVEQLKETFRAQGGSYAEAAQLQQRPAPRGGGLFKRANFIPIDFAPEGGRTVRGWDLAGSKKRQSAYTVGAKLRRVKGKLYILDIVRKRATPNEVEDMVLNCARLDDKQTTISIPQDPGQAGLAQKAQFAAKLMGYRFHFSTETGDKEDRANPFAAQVEAGNVYIVRGPWNDAFLSEAEMFPTGEFKDQIDALSRAFSRLLTEPELMIATTPAKVIG